jgi:hypothetical protein
MKNPHKNSLINKSLEYLKKSSTELLNLGIDIMFNPEKIVGGLYQYRGRRKYYNSTKIHHLKNSPYFSVKNDKIYLTTKGRIKIIKNVIKDKKEIKKWDGKWLSIIFDIPEATKHERNWLRRELKWIGFKELQHSVWITPCKIEKELMALLSLWHKDFRGDIRFLKIDKISNDKDLKTFFNLD